MTPKVFDEGHYDDPPPDPGITDEVWCYLMANPSGTVGVAYFETAGGAQVPLVAPTESRAGQLHPLAQALANLTGKDLTLAVFSKRRNFATITPDEPKP